LNPNSLLVLSGGTGTPKLLRGLVEVFEPSCVTVAVNTAEDMWISGNLVCPDLDTVLYTLAGIGDEQRWWGIAGDSFITHHELLKAGGQELLALGDRDRAFHIRRSNLIRSGLTLSQAVDIVRRELGVMVGVVPMSDDPVATTLMTRQGPMHFQEYWIGSGGRPEVERIIFSGLDQARPSPGLIRALSASRAVLIGPSNPVTSIGPILGIPGVRDRLKDKTVIAISPFCGDRPFSGPAARLMQAAGAAPNDSGVSDLLGRIDHFVVSPESRYPGPCLRTDLTITDRSDSVRLARFIHGLMMGEQPSDRTGD